MAFRHGVYTSEIPTAILPSRSVDSNVVFAVGAAPVHTLSSDKPIYVNKPRCFYSYDEFVDEFGWDADHFNDYSLQELIYSHFALYRGAPVVIVNVFDPKGKHKASTSETVTFEGDKGQLAHNGVFDVEVTATEPTTQTIETTDTLTMVGGVATLAHQNVSNVSVKETVEGTEKTLVAGTDYTLDATAGTVTRLESGDISSDTATLDITYSYTTTTAKVYVEGTDYDVNKLTGEIILLEDGEIALSSTVAVNYNFGDVTRVTTDDILGGIDQDGNSMGLELIDSVFPLFRVVPGSILVPKYCEDPAVTVVMAAKSHNINGLFQAIAIADIPSDYENGVTKYTEIGAYKQNNNLVDNHLIICWPKVKLGDRVFGLATQLTGLMSEIDYENDGVPFTPVSNHNLNITSIGYVGKDGVWEELALGQEKVNALNGVGVYSALNWDGGLRSWGGRMSVYDTVTDPKDCQENIRRMFNWYQNTFILTYFQKVDAPLTRRFIQTILRSENIRLEAYTAREMLLGGRITFEENENPLTDLIDGIVRFHIMLTPPPAARDVEASFEFDVDNMAALFS